MWIRSQDRCRLMEVKLVNHWNGSAHYDMGKRGHWVTCSQYEEIDEDVYLGKYATKERVIEIIDDIQLRIKNIEIAKLGGLNPYDVTFVYQMPLE